MNVSDIVAMIDADLERLRAVRRLLLDDEAAPVVAKVRVARPRTPAKSVSDAAAVSVVPRGAGEGTAVVRRQRPVADVAAVPVAMQTVEEAAPRARRRQPVSRARVGAAEAHPLRGSIPTGPVFVPVQSIVRETKGRQHGQTIEQYAAAAVASGALTAEALSRQWLRRETA